MKWLAVVVAACGSAPPAVAPHVAEPTGPELVIQTPGATAFAIDGRDVYWLAPGSGVWKAQTKLADAGSDAHDLVRDAGELYWVNGDDIARIELATGSAGEAIAVHATVEAIAAARGRIDGVRVVDGARTLVPIVGDGREPIALDGDTPVIAEGATVVVGTSTMLYQGSAATPIEGGVRALAVDGDDSFFGNTSIFEKYGRGPVLRLGPAGGPVTALAVDPAYVYWAIAAAIATRRSIARSERSPSSSWSRASAARRS
jgi:hypothetical protein